MNETIILCLSMLLLTSFVRVFTSLSILRVGLGLYSSSFGIIVFALSIAICFYVSSPYIEKVGGISNISNYEAMQEEFKPFMEQKVDRGLYENFRDKFKPKNLAESIAENQDEIQNANLKISQKKELDLLTFSFVVSELKDALKYGLVILIPFLIIDLIIMNIFMVLGVKDFSYQIASLPIKLGIFVSCDGLRIVSEKLINYYL